MANESMNQLIFTEETLKQFIEDCHKEYKLEGGCYLFEDAHSPIPKPLGGTEIASLTRKHHCIHDVMQSEVYQCKCFFNDAKQYLVEEWQFLRPIYNKWVNDHNKKVNDKLHEKKNDEGKSIHAIKMAEVSHSERDGEGKSVSAVRKAKKLHEERNEEGKSVHALEMSKKLHEEKDEDGKSAFAVKNSKKQHEEMKEQDPEAYHEFQRNAALKGGSKKFFVCLETGHLSNATGMGRYHQKRGIPKNRKILLTLEEFAFITVWGDPPHFKSVRKTLSN